MCKIDSLSKKQFKENATEQSSKRICNQNSGSGKTIIKTWYFGYGSICPPEALQGGLIFKTVKYSTFMVKSKFDLVFYGAIGYAGLVLMIDSGKWYFLILKNLQNSIGIYIFLTDVVSLINSLYN